MRAMFFALVWVAVSTCRADLGRGFTRPVASGDTRVVYVSSAGDDRNDGLAPARPKRSLAAGYSLMRDGRPDWLLLRRGDRWSTPFPMWSKSGRSESERMIIASYGAGGVRPELRLTDASAFVKGGMAPLHNLAMLGVSMVAESRSDADSHSGLVLVGDVTDLYFEDCVVRGFLNGVNISVSGGTNTLDRVTFRRCMILDSWAKAPLRSQGIFAHGVTNLTITGCLFDHNGFNDAVLGAEATIYNHAIYVQTSCGPATVSGNVILRSSSHATQLRSGGTFSGNVLVRNPLAVLVGGGDTPVEGGVRAEVLRNVILEGNDIGWRPRGFGIDLKNIASARVRDNLIANVASSSASFAIGSLISGPSGVGLRDTEISSNRVYNWSSGIRVGDLGQEYSGVVVGGNTVEDGSGLPQRFLAWNSRPDWSGVVWQDQRYYSSVLRPFYGSGFVDWETWAAGSGEVDSSFTMGPSSDRPVPAFSEGLGAVAERRFADLDAAAAYLRSRGQGRWRPADDAANLVGYFFHGAVPPPPAVACSTPAGAGRGL